MSNYPNQIDTDVELPPVNDNIDDIGADAINATRDAIIEIEQFVGTGSSGTMSLVDRLGVIVNPQGIVNSSIITNLGLVSIPIYDGYIADAAGIQESKLNLDYHTIDLFNYIQDLSRGVNSVAGWISVEGVKLDPHLDGVIYRHNLTQIDVIETSANYLNNVFRTNRDNINSYLVINDMNSELLYHQWTDGTAINAVGNIVTNGGLTYPSNYGHTANGIYLSSSTFENTPTSIQDVQAFANYVDSNIFEVETTVKNLFANGISKDSGSYSLTTDGYGQLVVPITPATAYLQTMGMPLDDYNFGDDIIQFNPTDDGYLFDSQFALVRVGDIITINYGAAETSFVIREKKYSQNIYSVRIAGKNLFNTASAIAQITRPTFNNNKYGVLATAPVSVSGPPPGLSSLIISDPRGAQALGMGFNPDQFDSLHYNLYLILYPFGNPADGYAIDLLPIDVTGNLGVTPGQYTLENIVNATNAAFRSQGYNYRFIAFSYEGQFGIMLADSYNNASFSIAGFGLDSNGNPLSNYSNNVIDFYNFTTPRIPSAPDPLGFGPTGANLASPPYSTSYVNSISAATYPTIIFTPLKKNNYYVNGVEASTLSLPNTIDGYQFVDQYGDGYWLATITNVTPIFGRTIVKYTVQYNLDSISNLSPGKTIVVQPAGPGGSFIDYGRFIVNDMSVICGVAQTATITVWDGRQSTGLNGATPTAPIGTLVAIYFSSDSVAFNNENSSDISSPSYLEIKRHFETYIDAAQNTYPIERARFFAGSSLIVVNGINVYAGNLLNIYNINIERVSPKLRGYQYGTVNKITLQIQSYNSTTGIYDGYLCNISQDGSSFSNLGPLTSGKMGQTTRFYDETYIDYIDFVFDSDFPVPTWNSPKSMDIQLFPTLALDKQMMLLSTCQLTNPGQTVDHFIDQRQFGNVSVDELSTSALNYIAAPTKHLSENGIIRGFDTSTFIDGYGRGIITVSGGVAIIDGKIVKVNNTVTTIPAVVEAIYAELDNVNYSLVNTAITWFVCVNSDAEIELVASTDFNPALTIYPGLDNTRLFYVMNPNAGAYQFSAYIVRGTYFADLVLNQKDLVPIAIANVSMSSSNPGAAITYSSISDARRYIGGGYGGLSDPFILSESGSFTNFTSLNNWLVQLNNFVSANNSINPISNKVIVKGNININDTTGPISLSYNYPVQFVGDSATINISIPVGIQIGSNVSFDSCNFIYNYDAYGNGSYNSINLVNAGQGMIYSQLTVGNLLNNINITRCTFTNNYPDYFPFINIQFNDVTAIAQNIKIANNQFISTNAGEGDIRAIIALTSITGLAPLTSEYPLYPKIVNVNIDGNICNQSQMIVISGQTDIDGYMSTTSLTSVGSSISNNICGTIGFFISANDTAASYNVYEAGNQTQIRNQFDDLKIYGNTCHLIANLNSFGHHIPFLVNNVGNFIETVTVPTGQIDICNNTVSWISVGAYNQGFSGEVLNPGQGVRIQDNRLNPSDSTYLLSHSSGFAFSPPFISIIPNNGIRLMIGSYNPASFPIIVDNTQSVISGNILSQNITYVANNSDPTTDGNVANSGNSYYYLNGIVCENNALINNNTINNVVANGTGSLINISSIVARVIVMGNNLIRGANTISNYVSGQYTSIKKCTITNNIFDSIYTDSFNTIFNDINTGIPTNWNYVRNTNQVAYTAIPLYEHIGLSTSGGLVSYAPGGGLNTIITIASTTAFNWQTSGNINNMLPDGTQLLYVVIGMTNPSNSGLNNLVAGAGNINIKIDVNTSSTIYPPSNPIAPFPNIIGLNNTIADVGATMGFQGGPAIPFYSFTPNSATLPMNSTNVNNMQNETIFLMLDMSQSSVQVYTSSGNDSNININFVDVSCALGNPVQINVSPIVMRYIWA